MLQVPVTCYCKNCKDWNIDITKNKRFNFFLNTEVCISTYVIPQNKLNMTEVRFIKLDTLGNTSVGLNLGSKDQI